MVEEKAGFTAVLKRGGDKGIRHIAKVYFTTIA